MTKVRHSIKPLPAFVAVLFLLGASACSKQADDMATPSTAHGNSLRSTDASAAGDPGGQVGGGRNGYSLRDLSEGQTGAGNGDGSGISDDGDNETDRESSNKKRKSN